MGLYLPPGLRWLGYVAGTEWPDGDETVIWQVSQLWSDAAKDLRQVIPEIQGAKTEAVSAYPSGSGGDEIGKFFDALLSGDTSVDTLAGYLDSISDAAFDMGTQVQAAKLMVIISLAALAVEIAAAWIFPPTAPLVEAAEVGITRGIVRALAKVIEDKIIGTVLRVFGEKFANAAKGWVMRVLSAALVSGGIDLAVQLGQMADGKRRHFDGKELGMAIAGGAAGGAFAKEFGNFFGKKTEGLFGDLSNPWLRGAHGGFVGVVGGEFGNTMTNLATAAITGDWSDTFGNGAGWAGGAARGGLGGGIRGYRGMVAPPGAMKFEVGPFTPKDGFGDSFGRGGSEDSPPVVNDENYGGSSDFTPNGFYSGPKSTSLSQDRPQDFTGNSSSNGHGSNETPPNGRPPIRDEQSPGFSDESNPPAQRPVGPAGANANNSRPESNSPESQGGNGSGDGPGDQGDQGDQVQHQSDPENAPAGQGDHQSGEVNENGSAGGAKPDAVEEAGGNGPNPQEQADNGEQPESVGGNNENLTPPSDSGDSLQGAAPKSPGDSPASPGSPGASDSSGASPFKPSASAPSGASVFKGSSPLKSSPDELSGSSPLKTPSGPSGSSPVKSSDSLSGSSPIKASSSPSGAAPVKSSASSSGSSPVKATASPSNSTSSKSSGASSSKSNGAGDGTRPRPAQNDTDSGANESPAVSPPNSPQPGPIRDSDYDDVSPLSSPESNPVRDADLDDVPPLSPLDSDSSSFHGDDGELPGDQSPSNSPGEKPFSSNSNAQGSSSPDAAGEDAGGSGARNPIGPPKSSPFPGALRPPVGLTGDGSTPPVRSEVPGSATASGGGRDEGANLPSNGADGRGPADTPQPSRAGADGGGSGQPDRNPLAPFGSRSGHPGGDEHSGRGGRPGDPTWRRNEDGSVTVGLPDGTEVQVHGGVVFLGVEAGRAPAPHTFGGDGSVRFPGRDGASITVKPNGETEVRPSNGPKTTYRPDGTKVQSEPGRPTIVTRPDGTEHTVPTDQQHWAQDEDGGFTVVSPDGTRHTVDAEGNITVTRPGDEHGITVSGDGKNVDILGETGTAAGTSGRIGKVGDAIGGGLGKAGEAIGGRFGKVGDTIGGGLGKAGEVIGGRFGKGADTVSGQTFGRPDQTTHTALPGGGVRTTSPDGHTTTVKPDGATEFCSPSGHATVHTPGGDTIESGPGRPTVVTHADGSSHTVPTDLGFWHKNSDEQIVVATSDGTEHEIDPGDGSIQVGRAGADPDRFTIHPAGTAQRFPSLGKAGALVPGRAGTKNVEQSVDFFDHDGNPVGIEVHANGTVEITRSDGSTVTVKRNGSAEFTGEDGTKTGFGSSGKESGSKGAWQGSAAAWNSRGDEVHITAPDGTHFVIDGEKNITFGHPGDPGRTITVDPDRSIGFDRPDGTSHTIGADGSVRTNHPDSTVTTVKADGTTHSEEADGHHTVTKPDGTSVHTGPDTPTVVTLHDGTEQTMHPDGSVTVKEPDGTVHEMPDASNPLGGRKTSFPDGSTSTMDKTPEPEGFMAQARGPQRPPVTLTRPDGTGLAVNSKGAVKVSDPNGTGYEKDDKGNVTITGPDGKPVEGPSPIRSTNGTVKLSNGAVLENTSGGFKVHHGESVSEAGKGGVKFTDLSGTTRATRPDGMVVVSGPEAPIREIRGDGAIRITHDDGTSSGSRPDGTTWNVDAKGNVHLNDAAGKKAPPAPRDNPHLDGFQLTGVFRPRLVLPVTMPMTPMMYTSMPGPSSLNWIPEDDMVPPDPPPPPPAPTPPPPPAPPPPPNLPPPLNLHTPNLNAPNLHGPNMSGPNLPGLHWNSPWSSNWGGRGGGPQRPDPPGLSHLAGELGAHVPGLSQPSPNLSALRGLTSAELANLANLSHLPGLSDLKGLSGLSPSQLAGLAGLSHLSPSAMADLLRSLGGGPRGLANLLAGLQGGLPGLNSMLNGLNGLSGRNGLSGLGDLSGLSNLLGSAASPLSDLLKALTGQNALPSLSDPGLQNALGQNVSGVQGTSSPGADGSSSGTRPGSQGTGSGTDGTGSDANSADASNPSGVTPGSGQRLGPQYGSDANKSMADVTGSGNDQSHNGSDGSSDDGTGPADPSRHQDQQSPQHGRNGSGQNGSGEDEDSQGSGSGGAGSGGRQRGEDAEGKDRKKDRKKDPKRKRKPPKAILMPSPDEQIDGEPPEADVDVKFTMGDLPLAQAGSRDRDREKDTKSAKPKPKVTLTPVTTISEGRVRKSRDERKVPREEPRVSWHDPADSGGEPDVPGDEPGAAQTDPEVLWDTSGVPRAESGPFRGRQRARDEQPRAPGGQARAPGHEPPG